MMTPEDQQGGSQDPAQVASKNQLERTQQQVDDVVGIMKTNVERMIDREKGLNDLDQRAGNLEMSASEFQKTSRKLKQKYWWKNLKMMLILGAIVLIVVVIIIVVTVDSSGGSSGGGDGGGGHGATTTIAPTESTAARIARAALDHLKTA